MAYLTRSELRRLRDMGLEDTFWHLTDQRANNECWPWLGSVDDQGYGRVQKAGVNHKAHRLSYELHVGPIASGLVVDHLCHGWDESCDLSDACPHRQCVNPQHLEAVTDKVNILRGRGVASAQARKTHCPAGHPLSGGNLLNSASGYRICKTCKRESGRALRARQRAELLDLVADA